MSRSLRLVLFIAVLAWAAISYVLVSVLVASLPEEIAAALALAAWFAASVLFLLLLRSIARAAIRRRSHLP